MSLPENSGRVEELLLKRKQLKASLTRFHTFFKKCRNEEGSSITNIEIRYTDVKSILVSYNIIQDELELLDGIEKHESDRTKFEDDYYQITDNVENYLRKFKPQGMNTSNHQNANIVPGTMQIQLASIKLPEFSGKYEDWNSFNQTFNSLIDKNENLTKTQKLHYLKSSLKGEPFNLIDTLSLTSENYEIAWDLLKSRYENKRSIIKNHISALFNIPSILKNSSKGLRNLIDQTNLHLKVLKSLDVPTDAWNLIIIHMTASKLDFQTKKEWEQYLLKIENITFTHMSSFLEERSKLLETLEEDKSNQKSNQRPQINANYLSKGLTHIATSQPRCEYCKQFHYLNQCKELLKLSIESRINEIKKLKLCINCLRNNHTTNRCISVNTCKICKKKHHTILHIPQENSSNNQSNQDNPAASTSANLHCNSYSLSSDVLLSTAIILAKNNRNEYVPLRCLLDQGSQSNFITEQAQKKLNVNHKRINYPISGIGQTMTIIDKRIDINIKSRVNNYQAVIPCLVITEITSDLPRNNFEPSELNIPKTITLADPTFHKSGPIDLMIGAQLFWELLCVGQIKTGIRKPYLQKTKLGWIVGGNLELNNSSNRSNCHLSLIQLDNKISKFWEIENIAQINNLSNEENDCELHFRNTHTRDETGRFTVQLPFKSKELELGESKTQAIKRFYSLENKLNKHRDLKLQYAEFINEYLILGHMELVPNNEIDIDTSRTFYLPHHAVIKESSSTTRLRVVFDASAKSDNGRSLNDLLMSGPTIQQDLFSILIRFRTHIYAMSADIKKMYRQVMMEQSHRDYQRIIWRENNQQPLKIYRLNTVTYGTTLAPFLAIRALNQLAKDEYINFPTICDRIVQDFYVDDILTGCNNLEEALNLQQGLIQILKQGGFELTKWVSNNSLLTKRGNINNTVSLDKQGETKVLGVVWNSQLDTIKYTIQIHSTNQRFTKRSILGSIAQLFDPLGLLSPIIIKAKILLQHLWSLQLSWDESLPTDIHTTWLEFWSKLPNINHLLIPRKIISENNSIVELEIHGFSDASQVAYGACLYLRTHNIKTKTVKTTLICAKSRVAPLKTVSLPRLELCGALVLAQLFDKVKNVLSLKIKGSFLWTDSKIVLSWLAKSPNNWKTFVANRISEIQRLTNDAHWRHVNSQNNPADLISRGTSVDNISKSNLWWFGPEFLNKRYSEWPINCNIDTLDIPEQKIHTCLIAVAPLLSLFDSISSFIRLRRIIAWTYRFIHNAKHQNKISGNLTVHEIAYATKSICKNIQRHYFQYDLIKLTNKGEVGKKSKLKSLSPFIDKDGLIRVGGRLQNSKLANDTKHPIILPSNCRVTKIIIQYEHERLMHSGQQTTLASLRQQFWPINGRSITRQVLHKCLKCFRANPRSFPPLMGNVPQTRVEPSRPFVNCGVDYAGPVLIREGRGRGKRTVKSYIAVFICFATRAIHIELVGDLTTESFIAALKRMMSRRGMIKNLYSDNATNFVGARNTLDKEYYQILNSIGYTNAIKEALIEEKIEFHHISPNSPHFGGLWEAGVKSVKNHIKRIIGETILTYEEFYTLLTRIEACLNSRPLSPITNDPNDFTVLTPGHFLIGDVITAPVDADLTELRLNRLTRWQHIEQMRQHFWKRCRGNNGANQGRQLFSTSMAIGTCCAASSRCRWCCESSDFKNKKLCAGEKSSDENLPTTD